MKIKDVIALLQRNIDELKLYDKEMPCNIIVQTRHSCCGDGPCYISDEENIIKGFNVAKQERKNKLVKIWLQGYS